MARPCTVCTGKHRAAVDAALSVGTPPEHIAANFGHSRSAVRRHGENCSPRAVTLAKQALAVQGLQIGLDLSEDAIDLQRRTLAILAEAEGTRQLGTALGAIREARGNLELLGKLTGRLRPESQTNLAVIFASPDWRAVEEALLGELEALPGGVEALQRAMRRLAGPEGRAA